MNSPPNLIKKLLNTLPRTMEMLKLVLRSLRLPLPVEMDKTILLRLLKTDKIKLIPLKLPLRSNLITPKPLFKLIKLKLCLKLKFRLKLKPRLKLKLLPKPLLNQLKLWPVNPKLRFLDKLLILIKETSFIQDQSLLSLRKSFPLLKFRELLFPNQSSPEELSLNQSSNNKSSKPQSLERRKLLDQSTPKTKADQPLSITKTLHKILPLVFQDKRLIKKLTFNQYKISKNKF